MDRRWLVALVVVLAGCGAVGPATETGPGEPGTPAAAVTDAAALPADAERIEARVVDVVDGDTVDVRYGGEADTVRLVGIDAPETRAGNDPAEYAGVPDTAAGRACLERAGANATEALAARVAGETVTLVVDPNTDRRGSYGRLLAHVVADGTNHNAALVARGHARVYDSPFVLADSFRAAAERARAQRRGLWRCVGGATPPGAVSVRVHPDAPGDDRANPAGEYVVLAASERMPVGNWTVTDAAGHRFRFPADAVIPAGGRLRVRSGSGTPNATTLYWGAGPVWNNDGDTATVRDADGTLVARTSY